MTAITETVPALGGVRLGGADLGHAAGALVLLHGRGASADGILELAPHLDSAELAWIAPQAPAGTWYPASFLAPLERNEPALTDSLSRVARLIEWLDERGLPAERVILAGFSQGACLALETAARSPRRFGAVIGFTGGRIGPPGTRFPAIGSFARTPVLLTAGDPDPHVPWWRVEETAALFRRMDAEVDLRRYPGRPHSIGPQELDAARALVAGLPKAPPARA